MANHKSNRRIYCQWPSNPASERNTWLVLHMMQLWQGCPFGRCTSRGHICLSLKRWQSFLRAWKYQASILTELSEGWLCLDIVGHASGYMGEEKMLFASCSKVFRLCCRALQMSVWQLRAGCAADAQEVSRVYIKLCWVCRTFWLLSSVEAAI